MGLDNYKITSAEISANQVQSAPDTLTGTPQNNKKVFDNLSLLIAGKFNAFVGGITKAIFPVGTIHISTSSTNPSTYLGGTWVAFGQGRTLVGVGTSDRTYNAGETGGSSPSNMPSHKHHDQNILAPTSLTSKRTASFGNEGAFVANSDAEKSRGSGDLNKGNLPPYITVYFWRRTA